MWTLYEHKSDETVRMAVREYPEDPERVEVFRCSLTGEVMLRDAMVQNYVPCEGEEAIDDGE